MKKGYVGVCRTVRSASLELPCLLVAVGLFLGNVQAGPVEFIRGDANCDGCVTCDDAIFIRAYLLQGGTPPCCLNTADANDDESVDSSDMGYIVSYTLGGGLPPRAPWPQCGTDPTLPDPPSLPVPCASYPPALCDVPAASCVPSSATVEGPKQLLWLGAPLDVLFDGSGSPGIGGNPPQQFRWSVDDGPMDATVLQPEDLVTFISLPGPGSYTVRLELGPPRMMQPPPGAPLDCDYAERTIDVVEPAGPTAPELLEVNPVLLTTLADRDFRLALFLSAGDPAPTFSLQSFPDPRRLPDGLAIDETSGQITWTPGLVDVGMHTVRVETRNSAGTGILDLTITVLDVRHTAASYAPSPGAGAGGGPAAQCEPAIVRDSSPVLPKLDLLLDLESQLDPQCCVQNTGGDPSGLRFTPACNGISSAVFSSASSGTKSTGTVLEDFTIEVWLANVNAVQQATPAFIFSSSSDNNQVNWMIGTDGGNRYVVQVRTSQGPEIFTLDANDFTAPGAPKQLAFARQGDTHTFYVDGMPKSPDVRSRTLDWDHSHKIHLGNSEDGNSPFTGDVYLAAFYAEALDPAVFAYLSDRGLGSEPDEPVATICPDPMEIVCPADPSQSGCVEFDGSDSSSELENFVGGGGAGVASCLFLRHEWEFTALSGPIFTETPGDTGDACGHKVIRVDENYEVNVIAHLTVIQTPLHDVVLSNDFSLPERTYPRKDNDFVRGDVNLDTAIDISDAIFGLGYLFRGTPQTLDCADAFDVNNDEALDISDAIYLLAFRFQGGPAPVEPATCGPDPTPDDGMGCAEYISCPP